VTWESRASRDRFDSRWNVEEQSFSPNQCALWEAARTTSASPTFFKPIKIEIPQTGASFVDGRLAYNNPTELSLSEAQKIWTSAKRFWVVSVGTGQLKLVRVAHAKESHSPDQSHSQRILNTTTAIPSALKKIADACVKRTTNSEPVHQRLLKLALVPDLDRRFLYHRFKVERGIQDIGLQE
jgi:predicted acylesterase/phospholipase RssA